MDKININKILNREFQETKLKKALMDFEKNKKDILISRGFYVFGEPGIGKTKFVENILEELNYDVVSYNASNIRNKNIIEMITKHNMSDTNILSLFKSEKKKIAILMDEIDGLSNGDKTALSSLIKMVRSKKTKKQKLEEITYVPIICVGNYQNDKKIKELRKVSTCIELKKPKKCELKDLIEYLIPKVSSDEKEYIIENIDGDLRKLSMINEIHNKNKYFNNDKNIIKSELLKEKKIINEDTKSITKKLLNNKIDFSVHNNILNETDRTSVSLLFHENIIDTLNKKNNDESIPFYLDILEKYSYSDYIDRLTFQNQIWIFNEISSLMKTIQCNNSLFDKYPETNYNPSEVRFTKILTKYSTEYNNQVFIQKLTNILNMDKKDMLSYFEYLRNNFSDYEILEIFEGYDLSRLDINRIFRFIDSYNVIEKVNILE